MATLSVRFPDSYHTMMKDISAKDDVSINQFIVTAVAEKISAMKTQDYLSERASKGSRSKFMNVLSKVPNLEPEEYDR